MNRRRFLARTLTAGSVTLLPSHFLPQPARAVEPIRRTGPARLKLSLAAYSFRDTFQHRDPQRRISMLDFVDYCAQQGCDGAEVTSYYFPQPLTPEFLLQVKQRAFLRGIALSGTAVGNRFTPPAGPDRDREIANVKQWIDHAALLGAPHIRIFAGEARNLPLPEAKRLCIEAIEETAAYAAQKGVYLGLENHGGIVAQANDLLDIVRAVRNPWVGINLDSGNFRTDDPYGDLAQCLPYAVNVQIKVEIARRGGQPEPVDVSRLVKLLREANYQGYVALEYEAAPDPWEAVPRWLQRLREAFAA